MRDEDMLMVLDQLPEFLAEYPDATLADIMAEFDLTDTEARAALAEYRRQIELGWQIS